MRRTFSPSLAVLAGLVALLSGCAGESPTTPSAPPGGGTGGGSCTVTIDLRSSSSTSVAGTAVVIRAVVTKNGSTVADGQSVYFTTDYGFFAETGFPTASKVIVGGVADITLASSYSGTAHVKATFECGTAQTAVAFTSIPDQGPFVSSVSPQSGSCAGGETVTFTGGRFTTNGNTAATTRVTFAGLPATIVSVSDSAIVVKTPTKALANSQVPEAVDVAVTINVGTAFAQTITIPKSDPRAFTYFCVDKRIFISSVTPTSGPPDGGTTVTINGGNFGTNVATTRVTFGSTAAQVLTVTDNAITVTTPRHPLANQTVPETVDVTVTKDLGLVSQQQAVLPQAFTYRASGLPAGQCPTSPGLFISALTPNTGSPIGGDVVTITGGGFGTSANTVRVDFGGAYGQVTAVTNNSISVSTPRHTLANPLVPETVNVVVTTDVGGPNCASATLANGFTYTPSALQPTIYSISPVTGPNGVSTRVTIFGTGFQFPMQVFMTATGCSGAKIEAAVISIKVDTIVFQTPIASNGNGCLANSLASITVTNPATGKTADFADAFKFYDCPSVSVATPSFGPYNQTTSVTINGQNFAEPVQAEWDAGGSAGPLRLNVSSVSASAIVVQLPPIDPRQIATGGAACSNLAGTITLSFPSLACPGPYSTPFTYKIDPPQVTGASPTQFSQEGCTPGSLAGCLSPLTVTVNGAFFADPMTVVLTNSSGGEIAYTKVNNATVSNPGTLTFVAPAIRNGDLNTQACTPTGGSQPIGTKYVPTSFGIKVTNARTGCSAELRNVLTYIPLDQSCRLAATITVPATIPSATICSPYSLAISGIGTGTLNWTMTMPAGYTGLSLSAATGATTTIQGTPTLSPAGAGTASGTLAVLVTLTDSAVPTPNVASTTISIPFTDAGAPFAVTGTTPQSIPATGAGTPITASPATTGTVSWTISGNPAGMTLVPTTGTATTITNAAVATGSYPVVVTGTDTCGHRGSASITVNVP